MGTEYQIRKKRKEKEIQELKQEMENMKINMKYLMANKFLKDSASEEEAAIYESSMVLSEKEKETIFLIGYEDKRIREN